MLFFKVGELLQGLAVSRSRRSIRALLSAKPDRAALKTPEGFIEVMPETVKVGETILVKPGEKVPLDGEILSGISQLDSSALTGEFLPLKAGPGDAVMAGQINQTGALTVRVSRPFEASSIARIMDLVENASARKANPEKFITTFARYYTPAVVLIAAAVALIPPLLLAEASFQRWIYRALVLLVISCPCALMVSIPLGYFGGIGRASRSGILVKGANFLDALAAVKTVVFDKTGTLTRAVFEVKEVVSHNGFSKEQLLEFAAAAECQSTHPIATAITGAYERLGHRIETTGIAQHTEIAGQGVLARYGDHDVLVGNDGLLHRRDIPHTLCTVAGTVAHVAVDGEYAGYLIIGDEVRADAAATITTLRDQGVAHLVMLTGDNECAAEAVAVQLNLDGWHAHLLPEDKVDVFERIKAARRNDGKMAFVGDGINDAPVLARADVGVAMGALGSDAAIETADVVLMTNALSKLAEAVAIAKHTRSIVWQNIGLVFVIKAIFIALGAMGLATMWEAVFADMGTALLAVANSTRVLGKTPTPRTIR
jgi:Cd2+/Zn2+-exporting ATPase